MACFIVPVTEAVVTTIAGKVLESKKKEVQEADAQQSTIGEVLHYWHLSIFGTERSFRFSRF